MSDVELFSDVPGEPTLAQVLDLGETVIRALLAAGLPPPYGFTDAMAEGDAFKMWGSALAEHGYANCLQAVTLWCTGDNPGFPSIPEFLQYVAAVELEFRQEQERLNRDPTDLRECGDCDPETPGYVRVEEENVPERLWPLAPCESCNTRKHDVWKSGHYNSNHRCHPGCIGYVKRRRGRAVA
jgi:hypothetical protein